MTIASDGESRSPHVDAVDGKSQLIDPHQGRFQSKTLHIAKYLVCLRLAQVRHVERHHDYGRSVFHSSGQRSAETCDMLPLARICAQTHMNGMKTSTEILAALAEPTRFNAIRLLWDGEEHCVCELMRRLGATQSRMSRHMATLKAAGLVVDRRDAQWVRYRRTPNLPKAVVALVDAALAVSDGHGRKAA